MLKGGRLKKEGSRRLPRATQPAFTRIWGKWLNQIIGAARHKRPGVCIVRWVKWIVIDNWLLFRINGSGSILFVVLVRYALIQKNENKKPSRHTLRLYQYDSKGSFWCPFNRNIYIRSLFSLHYCEKIYLVTCRITRL